MKADRIPSTVEGAALSVEEAGALLKIAYLSAASSGDLSDEECDAFARLAAIHGAHETGPGALVRRFDAYDREVAEDGLEGVLASLAACASSDAARRAFYDVAEWVTWVDGNQCDAERTFLGQLQHALGAANARPKS